MKTPILTAAPYAWILSSSSGKVTFHVYADTRTAAITQTRNRSRFTQRVFRNKALTVIPAYGQSLPRSAFE